MSAFLILVGLIDGAGIGMTVEPPATYEDVGSLGIENFYAIEYAGRRKRRRKLTAWEYQELRRLCAIWRRSQVKSIRDREHERALMRETRQQLRPQVRRAR